MSADTSREIEQARQADSVLRVIQENPGISGEAIARRLGGMVARTVRERIRLLRRRGEPIVVGTGGTGYLYLSGVADETFRAALVRHHHNRTRCYMIDHMTLMRQIGKFTAEEIAESAVVGCLVPDDPEAPDQKPPMGMADLARLPFARRRSVLAFLSRFLRAIQNDPESFGEEREALANDFGGVFLTAEDRAKLQRVRDTLNQVGL